MVDAGVPGAWGAIPGGQQLPRLHTAASGPAAPGRFVSECRRLCCAEIGSAAWPYVNELSPSDARLGTRDTGGLLQSSGTGLHSPPGRDPCSPVALPRGYGGFWPARLGDSISCLRGPGAAAGGGGGGDVLG